MDTTFDPRNIKTNFDRDGYASLPGFFSPEQLTELRHHLDRFVRMCLPSMPGDQVFYGVKDRPDTLTRMVQMYEYDSFFKSLISESRIEKLAETLLDGPVIIHNMQFFNKPAGTGGPTPAHQDGYYFRIHPVEALTFWIALEDVDEDTGCVRYVRGSHQEGIRPHVKSGVIGFSQFMRDYPRPEDLTNEVSLPVRAGDMLVHHALTIHRADGNASPLRSRQAVGIVYFSQRARHDAEAARAYKQQLAEERAEGARRSGDRETPPRQPGVDPDRLTNRPQQ